MIKKRHPLSGGSPKDLLDVKMSQLFSFGQKRTFVATMKMVRTLFTVKREGVCFGKPPHEFKMSFLSIDGIVLSQKNLQIQVMQLQKGPDIEHGWEPSGANLLNLLLCPPRAQGVTFLNCLKRLQKNRCSPLVSYWKAFTSLKPQLQKGRICP